jgi:arylsulfatase
MNRRVFKMQRIAACVVLIIMTATCSDDQPSIDLPESSVELLKADSEITIVERNDRYDLSNLFDMRVFKSGWNIEPGFIKPISANPTLEFQFTRIRDRILKIEFETTDLPVISGTLNSNTLPLLDPETTDSGYAFQWVIPASVQSKGTNVIDLNITKGAITQISSLEIQEGGARIGYAGMNEDIRLSLLAVPDVSVAFSVHFSEGKNVLEMSAGGTSNTPDYRGRDIQIRVESTGMPSEEFRYRLPTDDAWHEAVFEINKRFAGAEAAIVFDVYSDPNEVIDGDVVYFADLRLKGLDVPLSEIAGLPSIILITLDSFRADRFGPGGDAIVKSPALDKLAREGFTFSECICQINNTPPSHYTILSSKRPRTHGVYDMLTPLDPRHKTVPVLLEPFGYRSAAAVSATWLSALTHGLGPGFERFYAPRQPQRRGMVTLNAAREWLENAALQSNQQPFFFWLHLFDTHTPLNPPAPFDQMYYTGNPRDPSNRSMENVTFSPEQVEYMNSWIGDITDINYLLAQYRSEVSYSDRVLEDLRLTLARTGADRNTWIVITADHGISLDEHELYFIMAGMYEQQMHIPLIIVPPFGTPAGKVFPDTVESLDIAPTMMMIAGQSVPVDFEGRSLLPLIHGSAIPAINHVIAEHANNQAVMIRESRYKYIRYLSEPYHLEPQEILLDLKNNPQETINLIESEKDVVLSMADQTDQFLKIPIGSADIGAADSDILRDKLKLLGYITH